MYVFSFNIINIDTIISEFPITLFNENLNNIILEIRRMIKNELVIFSKENKIPLVNITLGVNVLYLGDNILEHNIKIPLEKIIETIEIIKIKQ